jgi:hypothetical protein
MVPEMIESHVTSDEGKPRRRETRGEAAARLGRKLTFRSNSATIPRRVASGVDRPAQRAR